MYGILMIVFPPSTEAGHLNLDERTAPLFTLTLLTPSKRSEEWMKVQSNSNLSTRATLGTEESSRYKVVAVVERLHKSDCVDYMSAETKTVATAERWPLWRGGSCGVGYEQSLSFFLSLSSETRETGKWSRLWLKGFSTFARACIPLTKSEEIAV